MSSPSPRGPLSVLTSPRTLPVVLLSFSSGLPLGLLMYSIPVWMSQAGFEIRVIGLVTLAHAPWTFKMLWSPFMDRYAPPFLGRRRGWIAVTQVGLFASTLLLAGAPVEPQLAWVILSFAFAIAFISASQDIVIDAYAVEILHADEQGWAVGTRVAVYRGAMFVAGSLTITLAAWISWPVATAVLAFMYLPMLVVARRAPEPEQHIERPLTLRDAVWLPFVGFLRRHRALEILAFVLLYKAADNLGDSLLRPFLDQMGYDAVDIGVALGTVGLVATLIGTFLGGALTSRIGLGHSLWIFGILQVVSNLGYVLVAQSEIDRPLMFAAMGFESFCKGLGMGAFGVLLLRLTQKRFSATQYAMFSSLFALPRLAAGPIAGFTVHAVGWPSFFWFTIAAGIPGLVMLARLVPLGVREPTFKIEQPEARETLTRFGLGSRAIGGGGVGLFAALATMALLRALENVSGGGRFDFVHELMLGCVPRSGAEGLRLLGPLVVGVVCGLLTAAVAAARHGVTDSRTDSER